MGTVRVKIGPRNLWLPFEPQAWTNGSVVWKMMVVLWFPFAPPATMRPSKKQAPNRLSPKKTHKKCTPISRHVSPNKTHIDVHTICRLSVRNFQWARRKRGYWPTTYMMLLATAALFSSVSAIVSKHPKIGRRGIDR